MLGLCRLLSLNHPRHPRFNSTINVLTQPGDHEYEHEHDYEGWLIDVIRQLPDNSFNLFHTAPRSQPLQHDFSESLRFLNLDLLIPRTP